MNLAAEPVLSAAFFVFTAIASEAISRMKIHRPSHALVTRKAMAKHAVISRPTEMMSLPLHAQKVRVVPRLSMKPFLIAARNSTHDGSKSP